MPGQQFNAFADNTAQKLYVVPYKGTVVKVVDGDTLAVASSKGVTKIRLAWVDAPESNQTYGQEAKHVLSNYVLNKEIEIFEIGTDKNGYHIAEIVTPEDGIINIRLLQDGSAWVYTPLTDKFKLTEHLKQSEARARLAGAGLWSQPNPVEPLAWRKTHKQQTTM